MKKLVIILSFLFITSSLYAWPDKWSAQDITLETFVLSSFCLEWHQTNYGQKIKTKYYNCTIQGNPYILKEERRQICLNPMLDEHPTEKSIRNYFVSCLIIHPTITYLLPSKMRPYFQMLSLFVEADIITQNYSIQHSWNFKF
jgi:hypothetical protein